MMGSRLAIRVWHERRQNSLTQVFGGGDAQNVLLVGVNQLAELYLRCLEETAYDRIAVVGILPKGADLSGRLLRSHKVLGPPEDLLGVARELEVHGAPLDRVVVVEPPSRLSSAAVEASFNWSVLPPSSSTGFRNCSALPRTNTARFLVNFCKRGK